MGCKQWTPDCWWLHRIINFSGSIRFYQFSTPINRGSQLTNQASNKISTWLTQNQKYFIWLINELLTVIHETLPLVIVHKPHTGITFGILRSVASSWYCYSVWNANDERSTLAYRWSQISRGSWDADHYFGDIRNIRKVAQ